MNLPKVEQKRIVIVGATGMVGGYVLRYALEHPVIGSVTAIVRRSLGISHPKLREVCIETLLTAPPSRRFSRARRQSFASEHIPGRFILHGPNQTKGHM
jgi:nucleoside-diphosphate-sugar epimerase